MGTWGTGLFSDDLAADLRGEFRELIGDGLTPAAAVDKLVDEYASSVDDDDEGTVFWLALADVQWKLGRLEPRTLRNALDAIDSGRDLARWQDPRSREKRAVVLAELRSRLLSPPPAPKRVPRTIRAANEWTVGEVVGLQLLSKLWTLMRVIGHHEDKGGRFAVCELLEWTGQSFPSTNEILSLGVRMSRARNAPSQFLFGEPSTKADRSRLVRLGIKSQPSQRPGGYSVLPWRFVDRLLLEHFGIE